MCNANHFFHLKSEIMFICVYNKEKEKEEMKQIITTCFSNWVWMEDLRI